MRRIAMLVALLLVPRTSLAQVDLGWHLCRADGGSRFHAFACDTNTAGTVGLAVGSFRAGSPHPNFVGLEAVVDIQSTSSALPDWWQFFNTGACRKLALSVSADFTGLPRFGCSDPFTLPVLGGIAGYLTPFTNPPNPWFGNDRARLKLAFAMDQPSPIEANRYYLAFVMRIDGTRTTGEGACAGCSVPVCITLTSIKVAENDGSFENLQGYTIDNTIGWQCGFGRVFQTSTCAPPAADCATPARNETWGRVKSLYR